MSDAYEDLNRIAVFDDDGYLDHEATAGRLAAHDREVQAEALEEVGNMLLEQYPEDIFVPLTKDANDAINGRLAGSGLSRDALSADIMRFAAKRVLTAAAVLRGDDRG